MMDVGEMIGAVGKLSASAADVVVGPYTMEVQPRSPGRVFLARAFSHFAALHRGLPDAEIERAFRLADDEATVSYVRMASGLIGDLLATGSIRSFARPFGGGEALVLPSSAWEIDDVRERFASCALDPSRPFEAGAVGTHWIFLNLDDWNDVVEASVAEVAPSVRVRSARSSKPIVAVETAPGGRTPPATIEDRLLRLPEVERRTGLSRSTIYRRIGGGRFPASVPLEGNIALWRESEVADWIADPR